MNSTSFSAAAEIVANMITCMHAIYKVCAELQPTWETKSVVAKDELCAPPPQHGVTLGVIFNWCKIQC